MVGENTDPRFEFTAGDNINFIIKKGQLQTDTITSKDAAVTDASIALGANATISTGGADRVVVDDDKTILNNRLLVGSSSVNAEMALFCIDSSQWNVNQPHLYGIGHAVMETLNFQQGTENTYAGYAMSAFNSTGTEQSAFIGVASRETQGDPTIVGGEVVITARNDGGIQQQLLRLSNEAVTFYAELHASTDIRPCRQRRLHRSWCGRDDQHGR